LGADFGVVTLLRVLVLTDLLFPVALAAAVVVGARLALVGLAGQVAAVRLRPCAACPAPVLLVGAAVVECLAVALVVAVGLVVAVTVAVATPRAGMGQLALDKVTGRAGALAVVAGFPRHAALAAARRPAVAVVALAMLALPA